MSRIYLDWAASAPPSPDMARLYAETSLSCFGNPSSQHCEGKAAAETLKSERDRLAKALGMKAGQITFTSGGTEACQIPLLGLLSGQPSANRTILVSAIEHAAVYNQCRKLEQCGYIVKELPVEPSGIIRLDYLEKNLDDTVCLVAIMAVNNETGVIQPIEKIRQLLLARYGKKRPLFLCDTVQAIGKIPLQLRDSGIDACTISGHKLGAVRGCGALILAKPVGVMASGGNQEQGIRAGTENLAGNQNLARAVETAISSIAERNSQATELMAMLIDGLRSIDHVLVIPENRQARDPIYSPFIVSAAFPGLAGETMVRILDDAGIAVSTGSACSAGIKNRRVLSAMGISDTIAFCTIRLSLGQSISVADIQTFLAAVKTSYQTYRVS
jgi:cysteine desulfurase